VFPIVPLDVGFPVEDDTDVGNKVDELAAPQLLKVSSTIVATAAVPEMESNILSFGERFIFFSRHETHNVN
jgi:hypothetical protein